MVRRAPWLFLVGLAACTPLRPLDPMDAGRSTLDTGRRDAPGPDTASDAPGPDAVGPDAAGPDAAGLDAAGPDAASDAPGPDAFASPDAFRPVDAFVPVDGNCLVIGVEVCGGGDEDCDGRIDESGAVGARTWYPDRDRDGYGGDAGAIVSCVRPPDSVTMRWVDRMGDCDDTRDTVRPGRLEQCNATDDDCDGLIDDGDACEADRNCWTHVHAGHTYQFCDDAMPWAAAAAQCVAWGYHLVRVDDAAENSFIALTGRMRGLGSTLSFRHIAWLGLMRSPMDTLQWTDGSPLMFSAWAPDEPNRSGECVRMEDDTGVWGDGPCTNSADFVCETP